MKKIIRLAVAAAIGVGFAGMHDRAAAQDRDPFGFYGFYRGQCARDPGMCRSQPGCNCEGGGEGNPSNRNERRPALDKGAWAEPPIRIEITRAGSIRIERLQAVHAIHQ
jgi:hypothetical protein